MKKKTTTPATESTATAATEDTATAATEDTSHVTRRGRPKGSKNKVQKKLTNVSLSYLLSKYGESAVVPVATSWLEEQARALIVAQIEEAAASAISPSSAHDSEDHEESDEATPEASKVAVQKTAI